MVIAGYFGMHPPGYVADVVVFAFAFAASTFFPAIILGIFTKRVNWIGIVSGMLLGVTFTAAYIWYFTLAPEDMRGAPDQYLFGISPQGIGIFGMLINFVVSIFKENGYFFTGSNLIFCFVAIAFIGHNFPVNFLSGSIDASIAINKGI